MSSRRLLRGRICLPQFVVVCQIGSRNTLRVCHFMDSHSLVFVRRISQPKTNINEIVLIMRRVCVCSKFNQQKEWFPMMTNKDRILLLLFNYGQQNQNGASFVRSCVPRLDCRLYRSHKENQEKTRTLISVEVERHCLGCVGRVSCVYNDHNDDDDTVTRLQPFGVKIHVLGGSRCEITVMAWIFIIKTKCKQTEDYSTAD